MPFVVTRVRRPKEGPIQVEVEVQRGKEVELRVVDVPPTVQDAPRYIAEKIGMPVPEDQAARLVAALETAAKAQQPFPLLEEIPEPVPQTQQAKPQAR